VNRLVIILGAEHKLADEAGRAPKLAVTLAVLSRLPAMRKHVFVGKSTCEFGARDVNHLQIALKKGYWADGRGSRGGKWGHLSGNPVNRDLRKNCGPIGATLLVYSSSSTG
jgi:hypothetical protein